MSTRGLAIALWSLAILAAGSWWTLSYRYSAGFVWSNAGPPSPTVRSRGLARRSDQGVAVFSGMGKVIGYLSWSSAFTRSGGFFEPVNPHEFPHPWFGFQNEGGRLWISFPLGLVSGLVIFGAAWHLGATQRRRHSRKPETPDKLSPSGDPPSTPGAVSPGSTQSRTED